MGLLHRFWERPVFRIADTEASGLRSFPDLIQSHLGIALPAQSGGAVLNGFVLVIARDGAEVFGPYQPNDFMLDLLLQNGVGLWQWLEGIRAGQIALNEIPFDQSFSPLCDYCSHNSDCPKFSGRTVLDLEPELSSLAMLKRKRQLLEAEIAERESQLKSIATLMGSTGQWIEAGDHRFKVASQKGRSILDQEQLKKDLAGAQNLDPSKLENIIAAAHKSGTPFERFYLSPINREKSCATNL